MGLFSKITGSSIDSIKFAEYVIANYGGGMGGHQTNERTYRRECERLKKECLVNNSESFNQRIYLLLHAGSKIVPTNEREMYLKIDCYYRAGASGHPFLIKLIPDFFTLYPNTTRKNFLLPILAQAYCGEKMHTESLAVYSDIFQRLPGHSFYIADAANVLVLMREPIKAMEMLESKKKTHYYTQKGYIALSGEVFKKNLYRKWIDRAILQTSAAIVKERDLQNYEWILTVVPDICPKSFGGYMRMKNQKTKNFSKLVEKCNKLNRNITYTDKYDDMSLRWKKLLDDEKRKHEISATKK